MQWLDTYSTKKVNAFLSLNKLSKIAIVFI